MSTLDAPTSSAPPQRHPLLHGIVGFPLGLLLCLVVPLLLMYVTAELAPGVVLGLVVTGLAMVLVVPRRTRWLAIGVLLGALLSAVVGALLLFVLLSGSSTF